VSAVTTVVLLAFSSAADSVKALLMFGLAAFVIGVVGQEFARGTAARRTMSRESWPLALGRLTGRNRRRYGGYVAHVGFALLLVGVAASSAFMTQRDARLRPGQSITVDGTKITYVRPTATLGSDSAGTGAPISFGAVLRATRGDKTQTLRPQRNYYPTRDLSKGTIGRYFEGEATSEVDIRWSAGTDLWTAVRPDISSLEGPIREANRRFKDSNGDVQALVIAAIVERYRNKPPAANFRVIKSPLVAWIWVGGGILLLGALIAVWPAPEARLRRVRALSAARVGRDTSQA
jgi:cytochrome c-type biogenesis protein CcmF